MGKIKVGDQAPSFKLVSYNAGEIDLKKLIGTQKIVIIFSRYFGCPICQLDLKDLMENIKKILDKGVKLLYFTQSSKEIATQMIKQKNITFPVIPSSREEMYATYGLGLMPLGAMAKIPGKLSEAKKLGITHGPNEGWENQSPGQFIIDEKGIISHMKKGWLDIEALLASLP